MVALVWLTAYFLPTAHFFSFVPPTGSRARSGNELLAISALGFELGVTALYIGVVFDRAPVRPPRAGFGIGRRIIQSDFMPVVALAFRCPVAGQNSGARHARRVTVTFRNAAWMAGGIMAPPSCASPLPCAVGIFPGDPAVIAIGAEYLRFAWNYVASGLVFVASSMFRRGQHGFVAHQLGPRIALVTHSRTARASQVVALDLVRVRRLGIPSAGTGMTLLRREFTPPAVGSRRRGRSLLSGAEVSPGR